MSEQSIARYGSARVSKIRADQNKLREAIRREGTPAIQDAWDRMEQWLDCPDIYRKQENET